jgi:hypothetical protein
MCYVLCFSPLLAGWPIVFNNNKKKNRKRPTGMSHCESPGEVHKIFRDRVVGEGHIALSGLRICVWVLGVTEREAVKVHMPGF